MDVCDENDPELTANCVASHRGIMPALVNNAGITKALLQTLHTFRERDWPRTAKVIPVSSTFGLVGWPWQWSDHVPTFADVGMSEPPSKKLHSPGTPRLRHAPGRCTNAKPWRRLNCNWFPPCKVPGMPPRLFSGWNRASPRLVKQAVKMASTPEDDVSTVSVTLH